MCSCTVHLAFGASAESCAESVHVKAPLNSLVNSFYLCITRLLSGLVLAFIQWTFDGLTRWVKNCVWSIAALPSFMFGYKDTFSCTQWVTAVTDKFIPESWRVFLVWRFFVRTVPLSSAVEIFLLLPCLSFLLNPLFLPKPITHLIPLLRFHQGL